MNVFNLMASLTLDTKDYDKNLKGAEDNSKKAGSKLSTAFGVASKAITVTASAVAVVSAAIMKSITLFTKHTDGIEKNSQKLGLSQKAYQEWGYILGQNDVDINSMSMSMRTFNALMLDAENGNANALITFQKLNLNFEDFKGLSIDEAFEKVVKQFQEMPAGVEKSNLAVELFGRSGTDLLPLLNSSADSVDELRKRFYELGGYIEEDTVRQGVVLGDLFDDLKVTMTGIINKVGGAFIPFVTDITNGLIDIATGADKNGELFISGLTNMLNGIVATLPELLKVGMEIVKSLIGGIVEMLPMLVDTTIDLILLIVDFLINNIDFIIETGIKIIMALIDGLMKAMPKIVEKAPEIIVSLIEGLVNAIPLLIESAGMIAKALVDVFMKADWVGIGVSIMKAIGNGLISMINSLLNIIVSPINAIIDAMNVIPGVNIKHIKVNIPKFAKGGVFEANSPFIGMLGDQTNGRNIETPESVMEDIFKMSMRDMQKESTTTGDIVTGITSANKSNVAPIINIKIGDKEIKQFIIETVENIMASRGLKSLNKIGGYTK